MSNESQFGTLADRLKVVLEGMNLSAFSRKCGVGDNLLRKYLSGSEPGLDKIVRISQAADVRLEWLATGKGAMRESHPQINPVTVTAPSLTDHRLMGRLVEKIMSVCKEMGFSFALHQAAERAAMEHDRNVTAIADPDDRLIQIGEVVADLRHELRTKAADPAHSKRQA